MTTESIQPKYTPEQIIAKLQAHPKFGSQIKPITKHQSAIISSGLEPAVVIAHSPPDHHFELGRISLLGSLYNAY